MEMASRSSPPILGGEYSTRRQEVLNESTRTNRYGWQKGCHPEFSHFGSRRRNLVGEVLLVGYTTRSNFSAGSSSWLLVWSKDFFFLRHCDLTHTTTNCGNTCCNSTTSADHANNPISLG